MIVVVEIQPENGPINRTYPRTEPRKCKKGCVCYKYFLSPVRTAQIRTILDGQTSCERRGIFTAPFSQVLWQQPLK